ncbi:hypothetical protein COCC4DRAFT_32053 [Bipolaris maydis ATCC 48331]|uniref:Uncharacterized protein n=2 Tax=Cochliobolus heterostrophus TaxID=5016 RepID=M2TQ47_COCH5|nr:uncharacterized protein COCC4DRAFT_32053 [Bipolaris maydis ATCC 48331]EMD88684.1 hypothetical protein COCHEDRAFT_1022974 [Bipolaris maydis C5]ENI05599.1 hypothetical protein COCC4DRAFT_32053 [Bipolaris maydis ATCC 48331]
MNAALRLPVRPMKKRNRRRWGIQCGIIARRRKCRKCREDQIESVIKRTVVRK